MVFLELLLIETKQTCLENTEKELDFIPQEPGIMIPVLQRREKGLETLWRPWDMKSMLV